MSEIIDNVELNEGRVEKVEAASEGQTATAAGDCDEGKRRVENPTAYSRHSENEKNWSNEIYHTLQAVLLAVTILILSYHGVRYGPVEYSLLENGQTVNGPAPLRKVVVTLSLGYSLTYSLISSLAALMLVYSLISTKPYWSLPTIVLCIAEVVREVGDAIVGFWLLFGRLKFTTAAMYTTAAAFVIMGELWCWLGVVRLYEMRSFK